MELKPWHKDQSKEGTTPVRRREIAPSTLNWMDNRLSMISIERTLKFH